MQSRFECAMHGILAKLAELLSPIGEEDKIIPLPVAIAYSGGLDSAVLLHLCAELAKKYPLHLSVFHVHHGISSNADEWVHHCQQQCNRLGLPFEAAYVQLGKTNEDGVEAAARKKRYAALGELCRRHKIKLILTAHHQDDQAETMLLQLLRGTGVAGLCGMQPYHEAAGLLGSAGLFLARPLLDCGRSELEDYASHHQLSYINDESNGDERYKRNALRHQIMPLLAHYFPGYQARFSRTGRHAHSALSLLEQLAAQDYLGCLTSVGGTDLNVIQLQKLPDLRIDNVLRYWLASQQIQMPGTARLAEMRKQLLHAREDAQVCVKHGDIEVHRYRHQLTVARHIQPIVDACHFVWNGEASLSFPAFHGNVFFDPVLSGQPGINRTWLLGRSLELRPRGGGECLRLAANRPTRSIKSHYQTAGIPYWQRGRLPFIFVDDKLLFAAGIGVNGDFQATHEDSVILRWQSD